MRSAGGWVFVILTVTMAAGTREVVAKRKDDRIVMTNGDRMVGEIKKLVQGQLSFKPDYVLNQIQLDWTKVQELESQDAFQVQLANGQRFTGAITRAADGSLTVTAAGGATLVKTVWSDVIALLPIETSFWTQLTGNLNSGFSYTSGNSQTQFSASGAVEYVADRYAFDLTASSTFSGQSGGTSTTRNTADLLNQFTLRPKWFTVALLDLLNSEQQQLDLRTTLGGGIGRWIVRTDRTALTGFAGLVYTHERYSTPPDPSQPGSQITDNIEGILGTQFSLFRFKTTNIQSHFMVYPSLTTFGRVRLSYAPTLNLEIARNLYWSFTLYENYDSQPPVNANKNDFGVTNSFGWKF
jgi:hypothetical protein